MVDGSINDPVEPGRACPDRSRGDDGRLEHRPACARDAVPAGIGRYALHPDGAGRSAARPQRRLDARPLRGLGRALSGRARRRAGAAQPDHGARPLRSGGAAAQDRSGRGLRQGRRPRHVGHLDFSTPDPRLAIGLAVAQHDLRGVQAAVAALHQSAGPPVGDGARLRRYHRAGRDRHQRADVDAAQWRTAGARGRPVDPDRHQRLDGAPVRRPARNPRRRSRHPHQGPQRHRDASAAAPWRCRPAGASPWRTACSRSRRRSANTRRPGCARASRARSPPPSISSVWTGSKDTVGVQLDPATTRGNILATLQHGAAARRGDQGRHHHLFRHLRHRELRGRSLPDVAEGRGADAARLRQQSGLPDPRRHAHRRRTGDRGDAPQRRRIGRRGQAAGDARRCRAHPPRLGHHRKSRPAR